MNIETDLQARIRYRVAQFGYTEVDGEDLRALPIGWVDSRGYQTAYQGHTDTYVVYHRRPATYGRGLEDLADVQRRFNEPYDAMDAIRWSMLQTPFSRDDFASRVLERSRVVGDRLAGHAVQLPSWTDDGTTFVQDDTLPTDTIELVGRDEHYRVSDSACVCGFETHTAGVVDEHLAEVPNHVAAEGPRYWKRCERCGNSVLCRRIAVSRHTLPAWGAPTSDVPPPTPTIEVIYRCDGCMRGL